MFSGTTPAQKAMTFKLVVVCIGVFLSGCLVSTKASNKSKQFDNLAKRYLNSKSEAVKQNGAPRHVFIPSLRCSGALVKERWVVTAASCFSQASEDIQNSLRLKKTRSNDGFTSLRIPLLVRVGNQHIDVLRPGEDMIPCLEVFIYPYFDENNLDGDLALLYLVRKPIVSQATKGTMESNNLIISQTIDLTKSLTVTGYGFKSGAKAPFSVLHSDNVSFISSDICNDSRHYNGVVTSNMICSEWVACSVDGGSPLVAARRSEGQPSELVGVFSWGRSCAIDRKEAVYAKIAGDMAQWLRKLMSVQDKPQCKPQGYKVLNDPRRNIANIFDPGNPLCDHRLEKGWYKLEIAGLPAELPTECPSVNSCGTEHPMWLHPESQPAFGENKLGSVCVTWMTKDNQRICCLWEIPVNVTHCGDFLVYQLRGTKECHVSYCSKGI